MNLEYLAPVVFTRKDRSGAQAYPDTLVGTDSPTPMINGLGVVGWGVGGIEAEAAMLGQPISMLIPEVVGFRLTGKLPAGSTATDLFAVDSIPAIFAITADPFLVFTSNVFAILGLRSLYFALAGMIAMFRYLKVSLALVLALVGGKMLLAPWLKEVLGGNYSLFLLGLVLLVLAGGVVASLLVGRTSADLRGSSAGGPAPES